MVVRLQKTSSDLLLQKMTPMKHPENFPPSAKYTDLYCQDIVRCIARHVQALRDRKSLKPLGIWTESPGVHLEVLLQIVDGSMTPTASERLCTDKCFTKPMHT